MIAAGKHVAVRYTERGQFRAPFRGKAATGKSYELTVMEWFSFRDGKIVQRWGGSGLGRANAADRLSSIDWSFRSPMNSPAQSLALDRTQSAHTIWYAPHHPRIACGLFFRSHDQDRQFRRSVNRQPVAI